MINKETYKRLTRYNGKVMQEDCRNCNYAYNNVCNYKDKENKIIYDIDEDCKKVMLNRLVELEDKIMDGTLVEIDESLIGQGIIGIHHFTDGTYQLDLDENIVIGFSSDGVITWNGTHHYNDEFRNGMFFMDNEKGKAEAEAKLKELLGE